SRLVQLPGVRSATASSMLLVTGSLSRTGLYLPGVLRDKDNPASMQVGPSFCTTMQIPILLGRAIDDRDQTSVQKVAVVNEGFEKKYLGEGSPVGRRFGLGDSKTPDIEVVGVSKAVKHQALELAIPPVVYTPYGQDPANLFGLNSWCAPLEIRWRWQTPPAK